MTKLEELRTMIAKAFSEATTKEQVSLMTELKNKADEAQTEAEEQAKEKKEILDDYKDAVLHGGQSKEKPANPIQSEITFEEFLSNYEESKGK